MRGEEVKAWLLGYAWLGTPERRAAEVECIMAQPDWRHVDALAEKFAGQASGEETNLANETLGFALSSLYECHDGPHLPTCPRGGVE